MRLELEALQPQTGARKWAQIIRRSQRVAGRPRSVSAAIQVTMLTDFSADSSVDIHSRKLARAAKKKFKMCAAYREIVWLDQKKLKKYLDRELMLRFDNKPLEDTAGRRTNT